MNPPANREWLVGESAAKRFWEALQLHYVALSYEEIAAGRFMAVHFDDGSSDNTAYESHDDAVASVKAPYDANMVLYFRIPPQGTEPPVAACDTLLWYARRKYDAGYRPATSHAGTELIVPTRKELLTSDVTLLSPTGVNRDRWN